MDHLPNIGPPPAVTITQEPSSWRRWNVLPILAALVCLVPAEFGLQWATSEGRTIVDGSNAFDGMISLLLTLAALLFAISRAARGSDSLVVKIAPGLLGLAVAATTIDGYRFADGILRGYLADTGSGRYEIGMAVEVIGGALAAFGGLATAAILVADYRATRRSEGRPDYRPLWQRELDAVGQTDSSTRIAIDMAVLILVGAAGCVLGWLAAVGIDNALGPSKYYGERLSGLALVGVLLGPAVTVSLFRQLTGRRRRH